MANVGYTANSTLFEQKYVKFRDVGMLNPYVNGGTLWSWGFNNLGQLGLGDRTHRSSPQQVGALTDWSLVTGGQYHTLAIKTDATLWSWGHNGYGQLGLGNTTSISSPQQVGTLTNWKLISGVHNSLAIKTDGTLWSWGWNDNGQLGLGDTTSISSPQQVGALTDWKLIAAGENFSLAIKTDGTLWSWGNNSLGQLGLGNTTSISSPQQVGTLTNWSSVKTGRYNGYHTLAIKTDATLWSWGHNHFGQLGHNDLTHRSSPTQVGSLTNWVLAKCGASPFSVAIKTDGTLWSWGDNTEGRLGLGNRDHKSNPTQVGALTNWSSVSLGYHTSALKTDGTLWGWGSNWYGQLGLETTTRISSPQQVGALTNWSLINVGAGQSLAIRYYLYN